MRFLRMATSMMMLAGVTLSKKVVRYEGGETELDEKVCLVKYEVFYGDICDPEVKMFNDPKYPEFFMPLSPKDAKEAVFIITRMKESSMQDLGIDVTGEE